MSKIIEKYLEEGSAKRRLILDDRECSYPERANYMGLITTLKTIDKEFARDAKLLENVMRERI